MTCRTEKAERNIWLTLRSIIDLTWFVYRTWDEWRRDDALRHKIADSAVPVEFLNDEKAVREISSAVKYHSPCGWSLDALDVEQLRDSRQTYENMERMVRLTGAVNRMEQLKKPYHIAFEETACWPCWMDDILQKTSTQKNGEEIENEKTLSLTPLYWRWGNVTVSFRSLSKDHVAYSWACRLYASSSVAL